MFTLIDVIYIYIYIYIWENAEALLVETLRCAAGSICEGVIRISHRHNPSSSTMALESTQPLTEMRARNIS